ncbi:MAG: hypothetical protein Q8N61_01620 [bacterium]|nr:hypothetical protein [bacterium]
MTEEQKAPDLILWVGSGFYPTIDSYVVEGMNVGCCKRIPILPSDAVPGKSRVFLAHDEGKKGQGRIFGFFVMSGVEVILDDPEKIAKYQEEYKNLNIQAVSSVQALTEPRRLCGQRTYGACYLVSGNDMDLAFQAAKPLSGKVDVKGDMVILLQPIPYPRMRFRGWRYMEPEFLAKYDWPQRSLPVKRSVKFEPKETSNKKLPLLAGMEDS